jgi:hypothetical protein
MLRRIQHSIHILLASSLAVTGTVAIGTHAAFGQGAIASHSSRLTRTERPVPVRARDRVPSQTEADTPNAAEPQVWSIPDGTVGLTPLEGRITAVDHIRVPRGETVTGIETQIKLEFTLQGCLDSLMPLLSYANVQGDSVTVYVTALNAQNSRSETTRCFAIPTATAQINVPGLFQANQIRIVYLGKTPMSEPSPDSPNT